VPPRKHKKVIRVRTRKDAELAREKIWAHEDSILLYNPADEYGRRQAAFAIDHMIALGKHAREYKDKPEEVDWLQVARGAEQLARRARKLSAAQTELHIDATSVPVKQRVEVQKQLDIGR
jgi:hypothetical protein